jgi:hypothetical protein
MSDVAKAVRENFGLLVVALQCDMMSQPENDRRLKITAALAKIDAGVQELEAVLKP